MIPFRGHTARDCPSPIVKISLFTPPLLVALKNTQFSVQESSSNGSYNSSSDLTNREKSTIELLSLPLSSPEDISHKKFILKLYNQINSLL